MKRRLIFAVLLLAALLLTAVGGSANAKDPDNGERHAPNRILVKFQPGTAEQTKANVHGRHGGRVEGFIRGINVQIVKVPANKFQEKIRGYRGEPSIEFIEPDYAVSLILPLVPTTFEPPDDPFFEYQWALNNTGQEGGTPDADIDAPEAWAVTEGLPDVKIAILDTGIDQDHEDLAEKIAGNNNFTTSPTVDDLYGHGTHVAGIAAAITDNGKGVAGVAIESNLMNGKVLDDTGSGYYSWVANGIIWAADNGAKVINLSLGGYGRSRTLENAVNYAWDKGSVIVAAAGNDNASRRLYPACYTSCIAVAATDQNDAKADFSNYGNWVDIAAPGVDIISTFPNHSNYFGDIYNYAYWGGTSMATPHVAGVAALVWATEHGASNASVRTRTESTGDEAGTMWSSYGIERVNAYNAVAPSIPNNPPVAVDDAYTVDEDNILDEAAPGVLSNDTDADPEDALTATLVSGPAHGTLTLNADGSFTYKPGANYNGSDSLTYKAYDGKAYSNEATVSITVNAVNDPPVANDDSAVTQPDTAVMVNVLDNDTDADGDTLKVTNLVQPMSGNATLNVDQTVTYVPNSGFVGTDEFTYTASDGTNDSNVATVYITVQEVATAEVSITMSKQVVWRWWRATATLSISSSGSPLVGATVYGEWSGVYSGQVSGTTANSGTVSFRTGFIRNSGTAKFTVTKIVKNGQHYTLSGETFDSISEP